MNYLHAFELILGIVIPRRTKECKRNFSINLNNLEKPKIQKIAFA